MTHNDIFQIYPIVLRKLKSPKITVTGISMNPTLTSGDLITLTAYSSYIPGDILVYQYKDEGLLVHRLLLTEETPDGSVLYHCKGDNAFRLETITYKDIIGKVIAEDSKPLVLWPDWKIKLSYAVHLQYKQCEHGVVQAKETDIYKLYALLIHNQQTDILFSKDSMYNIADTFCTAFQVSFSEIEPFLQKALAEH